MAAEDGDEVTTPDQPTYDTVRAYEDAQVDVTEDVRNQAALESGFAERRVTEIQGAAKKGKPEFVTDLVSDYEELMQSAQGKIEAARAGGKDVTDVENLVAERFGNAGKKLEELLERDLPEQAKAGIRKALNNQQRAFENFQKAMEKARGAGENAGNGRDRRPANPGRNGQGIGGIGTAGENMNTQPDEDDVTPVE